MDIIGIYEILLSTELLQLTYAQPEQEPNYDQLTFRMSSASAGVAAQIFLFSLWVFST